MFPIPWNFPLRKKNGNLVNIGDAIDAGTKIPEHDEGDAGKVLSVDENGDLEWSDEVNSEIQTLTNQVKGNWSEGGVNLFNPSVYAAYKQSDGSYRGKAAEISSINVSIPQSLVGKQLTFWAYLDLTKETSSPTSVRTFANVNDTKINGNGIYPDQEGISSVTFTPQSTSDTIGISYGSDGGNYFSFKDIQLEVGSSVTAYVPYAMTNRELTELATITSDTNTLFKYHKVNSIVTMQLVGQQTYADIKNLTIPVGFRPNSIVTVLGYCVSGTSRYLGVVNFNPNGAISIGKIVNDAFITPSDNDSFEFSTCYYAGI